MRHALAETKPSEPRTLDGSLSGRASQYRDDCRACRGQPLSDLEPYALERNAASFGLFVLVFADSGHPLPETRPAQMFAAGFVGWVLFVAGYRYRGLLLPQPVPGSAHASSKRSSKDACCMAWRP